MSRGPGTMQRLALEELERTGGPLSENTLCWRLAERTRQVDVQSNLAPGIRRGRVRQAFYKSFRRAVDGLVEGNRLTLTRRKLATVDDALTFYPDKTLRLEARDLRARLLPLVLAYGAHRDRVAPSRTLEEQLLLDALDDITRVAGWARDWDKLRPELIAAYAQATDPLGRDILLRLLVKCTRYFDPASALGLSTHPHVELMDPASLAELLHSAEGVLPHQIVIRLSRLHESAIPREQHQQRELKDLLFRVANFRRDTIPELNERTKEYLLTKIPDVITALPGHSPEPPRRRWGFLALQRPAGPVFSPHLNEVLNRHIFDMFDFVSLASG